MKHATRAMIALTALLLTATMLPAPASATGFSTLTDTILVPCNQSTASFSNLDVPQGWLAVTVEGACDYALNTNTATVATIGTPCEIPPIYNIPCVQGLGVGVPFPLCS